MNEFIYWPKSYILLSAPCDEKMSWMVKIWMENHLVSDSNCNIVNLQGMTNNVGITLTISDTIPRFTISIEQDN